MHSHRNVLVGKNNLVKISDFGLSRTLAKEDSYYKLNHSFKLPVKWMALESLLYQKFSTFSDGTYWLALMKTGINNIVSFVHSVELWCGSLGDLHLWRLSL